MPDFDQAYDPTSACDDRYECPLPPTENWLDVRIEDGETSSRRVNASYGSLALQL